MATPLCKIEVTLPPVWPLCPAQRHKRLPQPATTWVKVTLERTGDEDFVVNLPDRDFLADPVDAGDAVRAHWTASDVHLLIDGAGGSDRPYATGQN